MFLPLIYSLALSIFWLPDSPLGFQKGLALCLRCQRLVVVVKIQREGLVERSRRSYHQEQHQRKCSFLAQGPPRRHHFGLGHFWGHRLSLLRLQLSLSLSLSLTDCASFWLIRGEQQRRWQTGNGLSGVLWIPRGDAHDNEHTTNSSHKWWERIKDF